MLDNSPLLPVENVSLKPGVFGWPSLALMGVSFTAAGYYAPWSFGIASAGWAGMIVAFVLVGAFYFCLTECLGEMSAAIPSSGAGHAFADRALGPWFGFFAGAAGLVQWVCGSSALAVLLATYVHAITGLDMQIVIVCAYVGLVAILLTGASEAIALTFGVSLLAIAGIGVFVAFAIPGLGEHGFGALNFGEISVGGIWLALPFGVTFFLGLEGVPFAAEEARNPARDLPLGMKLALIVVSAVGGLVLLAGPSGYGLGRLSGTDDPILAGLHAARVAPPLLALGFVSVAAVAGLATALFSSIYAYSRQVFAMAREGELPAFLGTLNRRGAPGAALVLPSLVSMAVALSGALAQVIVVMVLAACVSYATMFVSFVVLRTTGSSLVRPYRVPHGNAKVAVGLALGVTIFGACIASDLLWSAISAAMIGCLMLYRFVCQLRLR